jgi:hypothetical protein
VENYEILRKIGKPFHIVLYREIEFLIPFHCTGRGRHSDVFEGINIVNNQIYAIKVLKPVKKKILNREVKVLQNLAGGPNIISLFDLVIDSQVFRPFPHLPNND